MLHFIRFLLYLALGLMSLQAQSLRLWTWDGRTFSHSRNATLVPMAVGSLQKAFVLKAWAEQHADTPAPVIACTPSSHCWKPSGHGSLDLIQATSQSCNAYFIALSRATPKSRVQAHLNANGWRGTLTTDDDAIGLSQDLSIHPFELLKRYHELVFRPWSLGEPHRKAFLQGMREAAITGTAKGIRQRGLWAKTGTLPSVSIPGQTCGFALAVTDAGLAILARLEPGVGREAAICLNRVLDQQKEGPLDLDAFAGDREMNKSPQKNRALPDQVRVRLLDLLPPMQTLTVQNLETRPVPASQGWLGPKAIQTLKKGEFVGPGTLEIKDTPSGLIRRFKGRLDRTPSGLIATLDLQTYVLGVIHGECPHGKPAMHVDLGAAILRLLKEGPRHGSIDVCDNTHCALYMGQGPRLEWLTPTQARVISPASATWLETGQIPEVLWEKMLEKSREPGPAYWSAHCGGDPLSPHALWGNGDRAVQPCPHHPQPARPWSRLWSHDVISKAFGPQVDLSLEWPDGVWTLCVRSAGKTTPLNYDQAHRRLFSVAGWDAMPSPARSIRKTDQGYELEGVGFGHRVGLCLDLD